MINFILCFSANSCKSSLRAISPLSFIISHIIPASLCPHIRAKSTTASVCPQRLSTPPFLATHGNKCPGLRKSEGCASGAIATSIVLALSNAETPVVTPYLGCASILRENAVCMLSVFFSTICGKSSWCAISCEIARQTIPRHSFVMKFTSSGVTNCAEQIRSPSFSLSSSSATMIGFPDLKSSSASSIVLN